MPKSTTLVDCDQFYVTIQAVPQEPASSFPLSRVEINFDNLRKTLQLEISDPSRNAWEVEKELSARMVLGNMMTHGGRMLLRWLMMHERIECQVQFMPEFSMDVQNQQMEILVKNGFIRRNYEPSGGVHPLGSSQQGQLGRISSPGSDAEIDHESSVPTTGVPD